MVAALLYALFPFSVVYRTIFYPDELIGLLSGLAVLFFLRAHGARDWAMRGRALRRSAWGERR